MLWVVIGRSDHFPLRSGCKPTEAVSCASSGFAAEVRLLILVRMTDAAKYVSFTAL